MKLAVALTALAAALPFVTAYSNPVLYEDLADVDLRRVNNTYYYSASTMHFSPGAPILRSYDLANWEYIGHSVPQLADFGSKYTLTNGERAYIRGVWASWLIYVPANSKWYWGGCTDFWNTHVYESSTSDPATSTWSRIFTKQQGCHYDAGAMLDTDGYVYVSFKDGGIFYVAQFAKDMKSILKTQQVYTPPSDRSDMEGTRPYKINGTYYIFSSHPSAGAEYALKASGDIWSTYTAKVFLSGAVPQAPLTGSIGQGALVDTPDGKWYWMGFSWSYPNGRIPCLVPVTWGSDGFPVPTLVNGQVAATYPNVATPQTVTPTTGVDSFTASKLSHLWEWNHDPDTTKFSVGSGLKLSTATVTSDLYAARNTITRRQLGPISTATIKLTFSSMANGDRTGFAMFRESSAYIGIHKANNAYTLVYVNNLLLADSDNGWQTTATGTIVQSTALSGSVVWLRLISDSTPSGNTVTFYYSTNGNTFTAFGGTFKATTSWEFFEGARYAIFNFATSALGGSVTVDNFELRAGSYTGAATGVSTTSTSTTTTTTTTTTSTTPTTTTTTTSTTTAPCTVAKYGQCGGDGYTGCKTCATGSTCTFSNQWYSQCL